MAGFPVVHYVSVHPGADEAERYPVRSLSVTARMVQFLTLLQTSVEAPITVELSQSLAAWLSYYRLLEPVRGGANPSTAALLQKQFVPLATALLDQVADTFCHFFGVPWLRAERSHTRLTRAFPALCDEKGLQGDMAGVYAAMRELHVRLMAPGAVSSAADAPGTMSGSLSTLPTDLPGIVACIEQYLVTLLQFFDENRERSVLHSPPRPDAP